MAEISAPAPRRRGPGRPFPKGQSGNPGGRAKGFAARVRELTSDGEEIVTLALKVMRGELTIEVGSESFAPSIRERMEALKFLAAYGWGQPTQMLEHSGGDGGAINIVIHKETP